jgi:SNF2 family DNA or RNA helicase
LSTGKQAKSNGLNLWGTGDAGIPPPSETLSNQGLYRPPTTVERLKGPLEQLRQGELFPEIEFDLLDEAIRLPCLYEYEFLVSLSSSRINLESYQVLAVYRVIRQFLYRFLIADDTRSKKTIEAEIILEELTA